MSDVQEPAGNLPATQERETDTPAGRQRAKVDALLHAVETRSEMLRTLLGDTGIEFERFVEVFRRALIRNPELLECDSASVVEACINACTDGLLPDGKEGAIVVYRVNVAKKNEPKRWAKRANFQSMYQGLLKIAYASGNFTTIEARPVYHGDTFEYELGDHAFIKHRPIPRPAGAPQPAIVAAYAVAKTVNGGVFREVFEGADIAKVNAVSRATNGPGASWPEEMARKGPLRRMWKFLPKNDAMARIVERDADLPDIADLDLPDAAPVPEKRLTAGFSKRTEPAQLTQGADPTMDMAMDTEEGELVGASLSDASNEELKSYEAPAPEFEDRDPPADQDPAAGAFEAALTAAASWLNVKQALKTFAKTEMGKNAAFLDMALSRAWWRMMELRKDGKDKTDFVSDPLLFECWLCGADPEPAKDAVAGNWEIVQQDKGFPKLPEEDRERIAARVMEALADGADPG